MQSPIHSNAEMEMNKNREVETQSTKFNQSLKGLGGGGELVAIVVKDTRLGLDLGSFTH